MDGLEASDHRGKWPTLRREPKKVLTEDERHRQMAEKRADFLIHQLGPSAEILDAQNREINGLSLRETLIEKEWVKLRDQAEAKKERQRKSEAAQLERETLATLDIIENWGDVYILTINGQRVKKLKKLETLCPFCGNAHSRPRGALIELYDWRRNHQGAPSSLMGEPPIKSESLVCKHCGKSFAFTAQVLL